jgi:hypothetical protein
MVDSLNNLVILDKNDIAQSQEELLKWIKHLNHGYTPITLGHWTRHQSPMDKDLSYL